MLRGISTNIRNRRSIAYAVIGSAFFSFIALFLAPELMSSRSFADEPITVNPNITIGNSGSLALSVNPNQFNSANQSITVTTSNYTGYTMTIAPSSGVNTELVNSETNTTIPSISSELTSSQFTNLSSTRYGLSINGGSNYLPVENGSTIKTTNSATNATTGAFTLTLGAKAVSGTPAGTYTKSFMLTAQANDAAYNITYDKNLGGDTDTTGNFPSTNEATVSGTVLTLSAKTPTRTGYEFLHWNTVDDDSGTSYNVQGTINLEPTTTNPIALYAIWQKLCPGICYNGNNDDGTGTMPDQTVSNLSSSQTLIGNNFSRAGYGFAGWSEDENAYTHMTDNDGTNDPTIYGPMETVTMPGHALNLYAVWVPAEKDGNDDPVYLQGWNGCSSLDPNEVIALTDSRDNSVYAIARLVDNVSNPTYSQCWMIENLRLDVANQNITYTNNNTNHPASSFLTQKDAFTSGDPTWQTCTANSIACDDQISYSLANTNRTNTASYDQNSTAGLTSSWYSYGGMYNWFTATAGNGLYGLSTQNTNTAGDLCPNGWHLPTGGSATTTDYKSLNSAVNSGSTSVSTGLRSYPANFLYSGSYSGSNASVRGSNGYYWSSTAGNSSGGYSLDFDSSSVSPGTGSRFKYSGRALRCLAGNPNYYIIYDANGGTGYGDPQSLGTTAPDGTTTTTLIASNFSKTGYGFAGWSRNPNADPNGANASTEIYGPNATITVPDSTSFDSNKNLTLYAIWVPLAKDSNNNDLAFQTANLLNTTLSDNSTLDSKSNGYVTALKDTRDNEVYAVAKLADGNYWMMENMRLDLSSNNTTVTTSNTNHPTAAFIDDIDNNYKNNSSATLWRGCSDNTPDCINRVSFNTNNLTRLTTASIYDRQEYGWYSYGIYYNWYTATGGNGIYNLTTGRTDGDLCPAGWHLPTGSGSNSEFSVLEGFTNSTGEAGLSTSDKFRAYPYNFIMSGFFTASSAGERGSQGRYWSSSAYDGSGISAYYHSAYFSWISRTTVATGSNGIPKWHGNSIRCLANVSESFSLAYNANGGTGAPAADPGGSSNTRSYDFTLSSTEPTRSGLTFAGWSTDQNATGESTLYQAGSTFTAYQPGTTTLYAVWVPEVIIHFDSSGGTGYMADQGVPSGTARTLRSNSFNKSGYGFAGWTTTEGSTNVEYLNSASYTAPTVTGPDPLEVTLYAVWGRSRSIMYNINTDDANANGTMSNQTDIYEYGQAELWASNFARPNYGFAGWSTDADAYTHMTDNDGTNDPTIYGPNETIIVPEYSGSETSTLTLYAVWVPAESGVTMQTFSPSDSTYSSKPIGSVIALNDSRDTTNVYAVAKLADGNWWMIENLRFDPAGKTLDNSNTNNPDATFASTVANLSSSAFCTGASGCSEQYSVGVGNTIISSSTMLRVNGNQTSSWYSYGIMYNWYTATAGHGLYNTPESDGPMPGDICPAGWHLPYGGVGTGVKGGGTSGGFSYLDTLLTSPDGSHGTGGAQYTSKATQRWRVYPNNIVFNGFYRGSGATNRGIGGDYWSSTSSGGGSARYLGVSTNIVSPGNDTTPSTHGMAVRCIASPRQTLTLSFDSTQVAGVEIDGTSYSTNGATISLAEGSTHTINMTFQSGYEFDSWTASGATVASASTNPTTFTVGTTAATITATAKASGATCTKRYALQNADGTYPDYVVDATEQVAIGATCSYSKTVTDYQTQSTSGTMTSNGLTLDLQLPRNTYTLTVDKNSTHIDSVTGGGTYRWGQSVSISATAKTGHGFTSWSQSGTSVTIASASSASTTVTMGKGNTTVTAGGQTNKYTCTKRYRLQSATNTWGSYVSGETEQVDYGATCTYTTSVTDYKGSSSASNGASGTATCTVTTNGCTASIDFYRNTYTLIVNSNSTYISSVTGAGTKRWGEAVSISATPITNATFSGWSQTAGTTGSFANASNASTTFTMPKSNATIYANGKMYMQNLTNSQCATLANGQDITVYDRRDESDYTVRYLDSKCWMTQNLRITGTISATDSNFSSPSSFNVSQYDLTDSTNCTGSGASTSTPKGYSNVCSHYSAGDASTGNKPTAWYNYAAATAGSITGYSNSTDASSDICPSGWRLPTTSELSGITHYRVAFSPVSGGSYTNGSNPNNKLGYWWSSKAMGGNKRYKLLYRSTTLEVINTERYFGDYIRCVRSS